MKAPLASCVCLAFVLTSGISMRVFQKPPPFLLKLLNANLERFLFRALEENTQQLLELKECSEL